MKLASFLALIYLVYSCNPQNNKNGSESLKISDVENSVKVHDKVSKVDIPNLFDVDFIHGTWEAENGNEFDFSFWLTIEGEIMLGQYCSMNKSASRIDCGNVDDVNECYIRGKVPNLGNEILVEIVSCRSLKKGTAKLEIMDSGSLKWSISEHPGKYGIDHLAPESAILHKTSIEY